MIDTTFQPSIAWPHIVDAMREISRGGINYDDYRMLKVKEKRAWELIDSFVNHTSQKILQNCPQARFQLKNNEFCLIHKTILPSRDKQIETDSTLPLRDIVVMNYPEENPTHTICIAISEQGIRNESSIRSNYLIKEGTLDTTQIARFIRNPTISHDEWYFIADGSGVDSHFKQNSYSTHKNIR
jgi:hypothetical protein